jgi:NAD(P)H-dependent flavin oxidoreductase YrpB (nitropropane dioxygenase family)
VQVRKLTGTPLLDLVAHGARDAKQSQDLTWAQMALAANAPMMTKAGVVDGRPEVGILPTGQVVGAIDDLPTVADLLARIEAEARAALARLGSA